MNSWQRSNSKGFWPIAITAIGLAAGGLVSLGVVGEQYAQSQGRNLAVLSQKADINTEIGFQAALLLNPTDELAHKGLAEHYITHWQPAKAIESLSEAPDTAELRLIRAKALMELGEAQNVAEITGARADEQAQIKSGGAGEAEYLLSKGMPQSALRALQASKVESGRRYLLESSIWLNKPGATKEEQEKAVAVLNAGIKVHPVNLSLHRQLYKTYMALQQEDEAARQKELVDKLEGGKF